MAADQFTANNPALPATARMVADFPDYCVTPDGAVYGRRFHPIRNRDRQWKPLKLTPAAGRYVEINLYNDSGIWHVRAHILMMLVFVGPCPAGQEVRHLDGDKTNNRLSNLCYGTPVENGADTRRLHLAVHGEDHRCAKITEALVHEVRRLSASGMRVRDIASKFGLIHTHVSRIISRKLWRHVS